MRRVAVVGAILAFVASAGSHVFAERSAAGDNPFLRRFLALESSRPAQYRALRHLEARNDRYNKTAWMDVWTDADGGGFRYDVVSEGGSRYIQNRVFVAALDAERDMWRSGATDRAGFNPQNYTFEECPSDAADSVCIGVKPRRKDTLLVEGSIFLRPEDGDLLRVEGMLSKPPSFWTRRVEVVREYARIGGVRLPVAFETVASVLVAGTSTFKMTYEYATVNGRTVGNPVPASASER